MDAIQATYKIVVLGEGKWEITHQMNRYSESWQDINDIKVLFGLVRRPTKVDSECGTLGTIC